MHNNIKRVNLVAQSVVLSLPFVLFCMPGVTYAQYVPVRDEDLITDFGTFSSNFDTFADNFTESVSSDTDSLRNIIAGGDPGGRAREDCRQSDPYSPEAVPYPEGAWTDARAGTENTIPATISVQANESASLRCLLQEVVEWQKLGLSIQIHAMLKTYIADAQTKQLNNQLMNQISAASLNWSKTGNSVTNNGVVTSEAVYLTNPSQSIQNINRRQLDHFIAQAAADPTAPGAVGSLGSCDPWRLDTAANVAENRQASVEDPFQRATTGAACALPNSGNDFANFSESFNDPVGSPYGGITMWLTVLNNPGASPLGTLTEEDTMARDRIQRQEQVTRDKFANTGSRPVTECSLLEEDEFCLDEQYGTDVTPAYQADAKVTHAASAGDRMVESGNTLDGTAASSSELQSTLLNTTPGEGYGEPGGMFGYDETPLAESTTAVDQLVREFYDVIDFGYYGIDQNPRLNGGAWPTADWAQATMLMIYDEMKFDPVTPQVVVTNDEAPVDTLY